MKLATAKHPEGYSVATMLRRLWPFTAAHRPMVFGAAAAMIGTALVKALEPWPLKYIFDSVLTPALAPESLQTTVWLPLVVCALAYVAIVGSKAVLQYVSQVGFALVGTRVLSEVRAELFRHVQKLSIRYHGQARAGDLTVRVISDVGMLRDVAVTALMPLVGSLLVLACMVALMFWLNIKLTLVALSVVPLLFLPTLKLSRRIRTVSDEQRRREGRMAAMAAESIGAIRTVQSLAMEGSFNDAFAAQNKRSVKHGVKTRRLAARLEGTVQFVTALGTALVLAYGTYLVLRGELTAGSLLVFLSYLRTAFRPVKDLAKYTGRLAKASAAAARVFQVLDATPDVEEHPDAFEPDRVIGAIELRNVSYSYTGQTNALANVNVRIVAGERIAVVGASGAGKTTFAMLLSRLVDPTGGVISLDGTDIRRLTLDTVRSNVGVVLQTPTLFRGTIRENLAFGLGEMDGTASRVARALEQANLSEFVASLPDGLDTVVGERGATLSVGQCQRLAIARLILRETPIVVFDEPTSALDPQSTTLIHQALDRLARGRTAILVTHDIQRAAFADRILVFEGGKLVETGSHGELLARDGSYASLRRSSLGEGVARRMSLVGQSEVVI